MTVSLALMIVGLALLDSTSFGTSLLPLWLLLLPGRIQLGRIACYLLTLGLSYFIAGVLLALGAERLLDDWGALLLELPHHSLAAIQITVGLVVLGAGGLMLAKGKSSPKQPSTGALLRWRKQAMTAGSSAALIRLAVLAFAVEFVTMVPYLAVIGLLSTTELSFSAITAWIAVYCAIMIAPAAIATFVRIHAHERVGPTLGRLDAWLSRNGPIISGATLTLIGTVAIANATIRIAS
ncbi:GAP family protein [Corynebacterium sputi]|uniref:GAP family protein n=1 Tax=Corynebacterium sputi TaxID=489915 RepID=UPI0006858A7E|nr:GAP family protein [Corynebacterium sputi]